MGYESTLIVAEPSVIESVGADGKPRRMLQIVATFDLAKMGHDSAFADMVAAAPADPTVYWYSQLAWGAMNPDAPADKQYHFGDIEQIADPYGDPPTRLDFSETIDVLESEDLDYRRIVPCLSMLLAFAEQIEEGRWSGLALFHVGH